MIQKLKFKIIALTLLLSFCVIPSFSNPVYMFPTNINGGTRAPFECPAVDIENNEMILSSNGRSYFKTKVITKDDKGDVVISQVVSSITSSNNYSIDISSFKRGITYEIDFLDRNVTFQGDFGIW